MLQLLFLLRGDLKAEQNIRYTRAGWGEGFKSEGGNLRLSVRAPDLTFPLSKFWTRRSSRLRNSTPCLTTASIIFT